jgi:hypothetical protein
MAATAVAAAAAGPLHSASARCAIVAVPQRLKLNVKAKLESASSYCGFSCVYIVASSVEITQGHLGVNLGSTWDQPRVNIGSTLDQPWVNLVDLGSTLGQPWVNLGSTLGQPWVNLGSTLGQPWVNLGSTCVALPFGGAAPPPPPLRRA